jgi:mono/diheme cytochrome c family protein
VTFTGDLGGNFLVFNSKTGAVLLKSPVGGAMAGGVVTYEVAGKQYVAFAAGNVSRNAFGDLGLPSVVIMALDPRKPATTMKVSDVARGADNGRRLYGQVCQSCHGPDGNMIADHKLGNLKARRDLASTIAYIKNPRQPMPKLFPGLLDEKSVADVARWVHEELR